MAPVIKFLIKHERGKYKLTNEENYFRLGHIILGSEMQAENVWKSEEKTDSFLKLRHRS